MPKKLAGKTRRIGKNAARSSSMTSKKRASNASKKSTALDPAARRFVRDLLIRGEAVVPPPDGDLPPGATHRIVEDDETSLPTVERERFSVY